MLRIAVYDDNNKLLGQRCLPMDTVRPGYHFIPLRNEFGYPLPLASVFAKITLKTYTPDSMANFVDALAGTVLKTSNVFFC